MTAPSALLRSTLTHSPCQVAESHAFTNELYPKQSGVNEMSLPMGLATVPMANKTARIIWAIMVRGETYRAGHQPALAA